MTKTSSDRYVLKEKENPADGASEGGEGWGETSP